MSVALVPGGTGAATAAPAAGVTLAGNQFVRNGQPFVPHGFNSIALLHSPWCSTTATAAAAANFGAAELQTAVSSWHANTVRVQVSQPVLAGPNGAAYAQQVQSGVDMALGAGLVVIVSMQDQPPACGPAEPLPSAETEAAWTTLIDNTSLASDPAVMFELFNEPDNAPVTTATTNPQQQAWPDWLNGGREIAPTSTQRWAPYTPVGFQELADYLRTALSVGNVLLADGASHAESLAGLPVLTDPGSSYQIAYAVHPYNYTRGQSDWDARWGYLAGSYALLATEWNYQASRCGRAQQAMAPQFLSYMRNTVSVGVLGQALDVFNGDLMADRSLDPAQCGTASPGSGFDFLNDYMNTFPPAGGASPGPPALLASPGQTATSISLTWAAPADPGYPAADLSYAVYRGGQVAGTTPPGTTSFTDTGLSAGTGYSYTVTATDPAGNTSAPSAALWQATRQDTTKPNPATGLTATAESSSRVRLSWSPGSDPESGVKQYYIVRNGARVATMPATSTTFTDTRLRAHTTYTYMVVTVNGAGLTAASAPVEVTTP